jgi:hypothetical protein
VKQIILFMEGGLIQSACNIPEDIEIVVRDYDPCMGEGHPNVHRDAKGHLYFENSWTSADNQSEEDAVPV